MGNLISPCAAALKREILLRHTVVLLYILHQRWSYNAYYLVCFSGRGSHIGFYGIYPIFPHTLPEHFVLTMWPVTEEIYYAKLNTPYHIPS